MPLKELIESIVTKDFLKADDLINEAFERIVGDKITEVRKQVASEMFDLEEGKKTSHYASTRPHFPGRYGGLKISPSSPDKDDKPAPVDPNSAKGKAFAAIEAGAKDAASKHVQRMKSWAAEKAKRDKDWGK